MNVDRKVGMSKQHGTVECTVPCHVGLPKCHKYGKALVIITYKTLMPRFQKYTFHTLLTIVAPIELETNKMMTSWFFIVSFATLARINDSNQHLLRQRNFSLTTYILMTIKKEQMISI